MPHSITEQRPHYSKSSGCYDLQVPEVTVRAAEKLLMDQQADERHTTVNLGLIWSQGATRALWLLRAGSRDRINLAANALHFCKLPIPSIDLLEGIPDGKLGGNNEEFEFLNSIREDLVQSLGFIAALPETQSSSTEKALAKQLDEEVTRHVAVVVEKIRKMIISPSLRQEFIVQFIQAWREKFLPENYRSTREKVVKLRDLLMQLDDVGLTDKMRDEIFLQVSVRLVALDEATKSP